MFWRDAPLKSRACHPKHRDPWDRPNGARWGCGHLDVPGPTPALLAWSSAAALRRQGPLPSLGSEKPQKAPHKDLHDSRQPGSCVGLWPGPPGAGASLGPHAAALGCLSQGPRSIDLSLSQSCQDDLGLWLGRQAGLETRPQWGNPCHHVRGNPGSSAQGWGMELRAAVGSTFSPVTLGKPLAGLRESSKGSLPSDAAR